MYLLFGKDFHHAIEFLYILYWTGFCFVSGVNLCRIVCVCLQKKVADEISCGASAVFV